MKIKLALFFIILINICISTQGAIYWEHQKPENDNVVSGGSITIGSEQVSSGSSLENENIIKVREYYLSNNTLVFSPINQEIDTSKIKERVCVLSGPYQHTNYHNCSIDWDSTDNIDTSKPGRIILTGNAVAPHGYEFDQLVKIEKPIILYDDNNSTEYIEKVEYNARTYPIALGGDFSSYLDKKITVCTTAGDKFQADIQWLNTTAPYIPGEFEVTGKVVLPKGVTAKNEYDTMIKRKFYAMKDDKIYIKTSYIQGGNIVYKWLYYVEDPENIEVQYSFDNENWLVSKEDEFGILNNDSFFLIPISFMSDKDYYFRLSYNGELTDTIFYDHKNTTTTIIGGDHDGGDNFEQEIPPVQVVAPSNKRPKSSSSGHIGKQQNVSTNSHSSNENHEKQIETSNPDTTVISGNRLIDLAELNNKITFEKHGISAELDKNFIIENNIKNEDTVSVTIDKRDEDNFSVDINVNNTTVKKIPDTVIIIANKTSNTSNDNITKFVINETGQHNVSNEMNDECKAEKNINAKLVNFDADKNNNAELDGNTPQKNDAYKKTSTVSPLIIVISIAITAGLIYLLWKVLNKYAKQK